MVNHPAAVEFVRASLRAAKATHGLTWSDVSAELAKFGIRQSATNLSTKLSRGNLSAPLYVALMKILGTRQLPLEQLVIGLKPARKRGR